jgi:hypothetical protein
MKAHNIPHAVKFIADIINEQYTNCQSTLSYPAKQLFNEFLEYINTSNFKVHYTIVSFANSLSELPADAGITKKKSSSIVYTINIKHFRAYCKTKKYNLFDECEEVQNDYYPKSLQNPVKCTASSSDNKGEQLGARAVIKNKTKDLIVYNVNWAKIQKGLDVIQKLDSYYSNMHNCNPLESEVSATNPMDVVTKTKNYEPDCSSKQKSFTQDGVLNIVF